MHTSSLTGLLVAAHRKQNIFSLRRNCVWSIEEMGTSSATPQRPNEPAYPPQTSAYPATTMPAYTYPTSAVAYSGYPVNAYAPQPYSYYSPMVQSYPNYMYPAAPVDWYVDPYNPDLYRPRESSRYHRSASHNNAPRSRGSREVRIPSISMLDWPAVFCLGPLA